MPDNDNLAELLAANTASNNRLAAAIERQSAICAEQSEVVAQLMTVLCEEAESEEDAPPRTYLSGKPIPDLRGAG